MKTVRGIVVAILCMFALCSVAYADQLPTLALDPLGGAISGAAGTTVGWGFTLTNLGINFAVVTSSDFCVGVISSPCSNSLGTYTDFAGPQFIVVGPSPENSSVTQAFDNTLRTGMGSFLINPGATGSVIGEIALFYDLYSVDPNSPSFNPTLDTVSLGNDLTAPASVRVVPEPGSLLLLTSGLVGCFLAKKKRC
jgi:PEP-CTERM motif